MWTYLSDSPTQYFTFPKFVWAAKGNLKEATQEIFERKDKMNIKKKPWKKYF